MQAKLFLIINGLIVLILVLRLFSNRRLPRPTPLDLSKVNPPAADSEGFRASASSSSDSSFSNEKSLNCYFQFNGMMLDAYEVLGVPGGSNREACYRAYLDLRHRKFEETSVLDEAWRALEVRFARDRE